MHSSGHGFHHKRAQRTWLDWHVVLDKSFEHIQFGLMSWLDELVILLGSSFSLAGFKPIGSISDTMNRDGIKQVLVKIHPER